MNRTSPGRGGSAGSPQRPASQAPRGRTDGAQRDPGLGRLAGSRFDALASVARLRAALLIAQGDRDEIVPFDLGQSLFAAAPAPKRFVRVPGTHHNDVLGAPSLLDTIAGFARQVALALPVP